MAIVFLAFVAAMLSACNGGSTTTDTPTPTPAAKATADIPQFVVTALQSIGEKRLTRTVYEYTFKASIKNTGTTAASGVKATLASAPAGTEIIDGAVVAGTIAAGATVTPEDVIVLRQDRTVAFNADALVWQFSAAALTQLDSLKPAEVYVFALKDLGLPENAGTVTASGAIADAVIKSGTLRFSTPGDTGAVQDAKLTVTTGTMTVGLQAHIRSARPTDILAHGEPSDDGSLPPVSPPLIITGLGSNNTLSGNALKFKLGTTQALNLKDDSSGLLLGSGNLKFSLKQYWIFNPADNSFSISGVALQQLLDSLPAGSFNASINFVSLDGEFAAAYDFLAIKPGARISGQLLTPQGVAATTLVGIQVLLKGFNSNLRRATSVDAAGLFVFEGVIPDTYLLTLNDLDNPNVVSTSTAVFAGSTQVNVTMVNNVPLTGPTVSLKSGHLHGPLAVNSATQNGAPPSARVIAPHATAKAALMPGATVPGATAFVAVASAQSQTVTTPIAYTVPVGTQNVSVKITVSTAEYR